MNPSSLDFYLHNHLLKLPSLRHIYPIYRYIYDMRKNILNQYLYKNQQNGWYEKDMNLLKKSENSAETLFKKLFEPPKKFRFWSHRKSLLYLNSWYFHLHNHLLKLRNHRQKVQYLLYIILTCISLYIMYLNSYRHLHSPQLKLQNFCQNFLYLPWNHRHDLEIFLKIKKR